MKFDLKSSLLFLSLIAFLATGALACGELDVEEEGENQSSEKDENQNNDEKQNNQSEAEIEVAGEWENQFGEIEVIDDERWDFMHLVDFENDQRWAVTQNPDDDEWNPSAYNRLVWTPIEDDVFYYCTVDFGLETEEEAQLSDASADEEDLDGGCGGFAWTEMTRQ
jgi:hypothetical protein